jgi:hypothetical protein
MTKRSEPPAREPPPTAPEPPPFSPDPDLIVQREKGWEPRHQPPFRWITRAMRPRVNIEDREAVSRPTTDR